MEHDHEIDVIKLKDKVAERQDEITKMKVQHAHARGIQFLEIIGRCFERVKNPDQNFLLASQMIGLSMVNGSEMNREEFQQIASRVPESLAPNISETIEEIIENVQKRDSDIIMD